MAECWGCQQPCREGREGHGQRQLHGSCRGDAVSGTNAPSPCTQLLAKTSQRVPSAGAAVSALPPIPFTGAWRGGGRAGTKARCQSGHRSPVPAAPGTILLPPLSLLLPPAQDSCWGIFFLPYSWPHQPSTTQPRGQRNNTPGIHSLPPCGSIHRMASGVLFQLKVFD